MKRLLRALKEAWLDANSVAVGLEQWADAGLDLGDGLRDTVLGTMHLVGAIGRQLGKELSRLAEKIDQGTEAL